MGTRRYHRENENDLKPRGINIKYLHGNNEITRILQRTQAMKRN